MQITAHAPTVLVVSPDRAPLDSKKINDLLNSHYWRVNVVDSTGSTQVDLGHRVRNGQAKVGDVLVTEFQSSGRGRLDRSFVALPRTALLFSFFIKPARRGDQWGWIPLLAGQSVHAALSRLFHLEGEPTLKWPNDVLLKDKKLAGILAERLEGPEGPGVVVGIGINVSTTAEELPISRATSLTLEGLSSVSREGILVAILQSFEEYLQRWESNDPSLVAEYTNASATIGRGISVEKPDGLMITAVAQSVDESGALVLDDGTHITVGDVIHLSAK